MLADVISGPSAAVAKKWRKQTKLEESHNEGTDQLVSWHIETPSRIKTGIPHFSLQSLSN